MNIHTNHYHNVAILGVNGRLDAITTPTFTQAIQEQLTAGCNQLVADLKKVDYLSSAGVKALVIGAQQTRRQGGDFRIANARSHVKYLLHLAGVDSVVRMYPNVISATASFFPGPSADERHDEPAAEDVISVVHHHE